MLLPNHDKALAEFQRVLKPGGILAVSVWGPDDRMHFFRYVRLLSTEYDSTAPASFTALRFSDPKELMEAVGNAGLQDLECKELQVDFLLRNDVWWDAMLQMPLPIKAAVSKAQQQRPGEDVFGEARQKMQALLSANGCLTPAGDLDCCTNSCWLISAKKPG